MNWSVMQKDWFAIIFKVIITVRAHNSNQTRPVSTTLWTADPFTTKLSLIVYCCKLECIEKKIAGLKVKVIAKVQNFN